MNQDEKFWCWLAGFLMETALFMLLPLVKNSKGLTYHQLTVKLTQQSSYLIQEIIKRIGFGTIEKHTEQGVFVWRVVGKNALIFLHNILPYCIIKKEQVEKALTFPVGTKGGKKETRLMPKSLVDFREEIKIELKRFKVDNRNAAIGVWNGLRFG